jgi:3-hydroxyanthranilate 3,4-dioxygenase
MNLLSTYHLKRWVDEHRHLFSPPHKTNRVLVNHMDFIVMILNGPNARLDFHVDPGDEFFYQIHGDMELHVKPTAERRQVLEIREGEMFLCPAGLAHSPRRRAGTWGLLIERNRRPEETEQFVWFCEQCDTEVYAQTVTQDDFAGQVPRIYETFNADSRLRTCANCSYAFPPTPMAERLHFLDAKR